MLPECDARCGKNMDRCAKWGDKRTKCHPFTIDEFKGNQFLECDITQVCRKCSIFGNDFVFITDKEIEKIKVWKGFVLDGRIWDIFCL